MHRDVGGINEDVVEVDHDAHVQHVGKDAVDKTLERGGGVGEAERHNQPLEGAVAGAEGGLPFVSFGNADQMIRMPEIKLGVNLSSAWGFEQVGGAGKWVSVLFRDLI